MKDNKTFKAFRSELNESEYKETLTGYPNRGIDTDVGPVNKDLLPKVNAVLTAMNRYTYQHTSEALIKIRTRLNLFMLDFPWTPWMWQNNTTGAFVLPVTLFGRVDGVDGTSGSIRFDGRANPNAGLQEFNLSVTVETAEDGLYRVTAKLQPRAELVPEGVEEDGDALDEMAQTPARQRDMEHKIQRHEAQAQKGYEAKMHKTGKAAARGRKLEAKHDAASRRVIKQDTKEYESEKLYGRGGKIVKSKSKPVKEGVEAIEEMHKVGDTVKVPHKGKMVKGKIVRHDNGGSSKAQQHGGGYVVDVGEYSSITVPHHKIVKEEIEQIEEMAQTKERAAEMQKNLGKMQKDLEKDQKKVQKVYDKYTEKHYGTPTGAREKANFNRTVTAHSRKFYDPIDKLQKQNQKEREDKTSLYGKGGKVVAKREVETKTVRGKWKPVKEELIGGQKKLDVNKNKKLDAQDFKMLRAKKTVKEETVEEGKMKQWTPRLDKLMANRDAVRSKPKKMIPVTKIKDGKKVSTKLIPAYTPKKAVKEYTEMLGGIPLTAPDPTAARADKSGKGKRFHKGAIKSVEEAVAKGKKKKPSPHQGAANVIGKNKAIKSRLEKHDMRW